MVAEAHDRINVQNNPVNLIDSFGLLTEAYYRSHGYSSYDVDYGGAWGNVPSRHSESARVITSGQAWAAGKIVGGVALAYAGYGALVVAETSAELIAAASMFTIGTSNAADGLASMLAELMGTDTSNIPPTQLHMMFELLDGVDHNQNGADENDRCK